MGTAAVVGAAARTPAVRVRGLVKRYGAREGVCGVDLEVWPGEIHGLIGADGSGKSSLLQAISGVLTFDRGDIEVLGTRIDSERAAERIKHRIGLMPQGLGLNLYPDLSIEENVDFFARLSLVPDDLLRARKKHLLAITRLAPFANRPVKQLSGGMKQKLGLVCTLVHEPALIILDEPTTGIDPLSRRDFWALVGELLRDQRTTAIVSTAYMDEASRFQRMSLMLDGRIVAQGTPEEIAALAPGTLVVVQAEPQLAALTRLRAQFSQVDAYGSSIQVFVDRTDANSAIADVTRLLSGVTVESVQAVEPTHEDSFVAVLRRTAGDEPARDPAVPAALVDLGEASASPRSMPPASTGARAAWTHATGRVEIEAAELTRTFGRFTAVDQVSFSVRQGEIFGLLGANGAGKSTIIKMLTGIMTPTIGTARVAGVDIRTAPHEVKKRIGYMSQAFSLYRDLTVVENIALYAGIYGLRAREARDRVAWVLEMADLQGHERRRAEELAIGLRQRLALGCALVHRPEILFLDEPTSGVDPIGRRRLWDLLFRLTREDGVTLLVTTHHLSEAEHCDRLALMHAGRLVADAPPNMLKQQLAAEVGQPIGQLSIEDVFVHRIAALERAQDARQEASLV
jgi:ABC-2 type transport system ATP-binding protein